MAEDQGIYSCSRLPASRGDVEREKQEYSSPSSAAGRLGARRTFSDLPQLSPTRASASTPPNTKHRQGTLQITSRNAYRSDIDN